MSFSSDFILLRKVKNSKPISNIALQLIKKNWIKETFINTVDLNICQTVEFIRVEEESHEFISTNNKCKYLEIMLTHFNSSLVVLKNFYNLNPYNEHSQITIDLVTAKTIKQAIKYLLSRNYSCEFEEILDNEFISVLSELIPIYKCIKLKQKNLLDEESESEEGFNILKRMLNILSTYISICEENYYDDEYILIYNVY
jgi:hypothetical protein